MTHSVFSCHICGAAALEDIEGYGALNRVASDCRPWVPEGRLALCTRCGLLQKPVDASWEDETARLYAGYTLYHQGGGKEQAVFDEGGQGGVPRSSKLAEKLRAFLPPRGRLLDIGCGNGAFLRCFAAAFPDWSLSGTELGEAHRREVEAIPQVERVYCGSPDKAPGTFDAVTLIHVLEHVPDPGNFLQIVRRKLNPGGLLMVHVPDHTRNPFDLLIADHCTHFSAGSLRRFLRWCGFTLLSEGTDWVRKETTVLAMPGEARENTLPFEDPLSSGERGRQSVDWLGALRRQADLLSGGRPSGRRFGLFGTAIAATWLASELHMRFDFFVEEDANRVGKVLMGRPVLHPDSIPDASGVFLPLPVPIAREIRERLRKTRPSVRFHGPDDGASDAPDAL